MVSILLYSFLLLLCSLLRITRVSTASNIYEVCMLSFHLTLIVDSIKCITIIWLPKKKKKNFLTFSYWCDIKVYGESLVCVGDPDEPHSHGHRL